MRNRTLLSIFCSLLLFSSCRLEKQGIGEEVIPQNANQIVKGINDLSMFSTALDRTGLAATLADAPKQYTVLAPSNAAFTAAGITPDALNTLDLATLTSIIRYHILPGTKFGDGFTIGANSTLNPTAPFVFVTAGPIFNGQAKVVTGNIRASNGVVHVINALISPPTQSIAEVVASRYSLLSTALQIADLTSVLDTIDRGLKGYTLLAPTDSAFIAAGLPDAAALQSVGRIALRSVLLYHVLGGLNFYEDLSKDTGTVAITMVSGEKASFYRNTKIALVEGDFRFVNGLRLRTERILGSNGSIIQIGGLLLPPSFRGTTRNYLANEPKLSLLNAALNFARDSAGTDILAALKPDANGNVAYTLLAPIDSAFQLLGINGQAELSAIGKDSVVKILLYHIVPRRRFITQFGSGDVPTLAKTFKVDAIGTVTSTNLPIITSARSFGITRIRDFRFKGRSNSTIAGQQPRDRTPNIVTEDAVVHLINGVILR
jgi:transforming growth factor-beta-induced protein